MATQKKYRPKRSCPGKDTFLALSNPTYPRIVDKSVELDMKIRTLKNYFRKREQEEIDATWKDVKPIKRSPTIRTKLNEKSNGGRKQNITKKKRPKKHKK